MPKAKAEAPAPPPPPPPRLVPKLPVTGEEHELLGALVETARPLLVRDSWRLDSPKIGTLGEGTILRVDRTFALPTEGTVRALVSLDGEVEPEGWVSLKGGAVEKIEDVAVRPTAAAVLKDAGHSTEEPTGAVAVDVSDAAEPVSVLSAVSQLKDMHARIAEIKVEELGRRRSTHGSVPTLPATLRCTSRLCGH